MGLLEVTPEGLNVTEVAPAGPQFVGANVPAHRASDAYREAARTTETTNRDIIL